MKIYQNTTDEELLVFLAKNDEGAFAELFERYWKKARAMVLARLNGEEAAKEIVQEIFASLWERRYKLQILNFSFYLQTAVKYKVINHIKQEVTRNKYCEYYKNFARFESAFTLESVSTSEIEHLMEESLQTLPEKTQEVFRLSRYEGRSITEIAGRLNLSEKAIQYHISKSLKRLRLYLKDYILSVPLLASLLF